MFGAFGMCIWLLAVIHPQLVVGSHLIEAQYELGRQDPIIIWLLPIIVIIVIFGGYLTLNIDDKNCPDLGAIDNGDGVDVDPKPNKKGRVGNTRTYICKDGTTLSLMCMEDKTWYPDPEDVMCET